jgi:hypothetical protein
LVIIDWQQSEERGRDCGAVKGIYDTGRMLYNAAQYIGPAVAAAGVVL